MSLKRINDEQRSRAMKDKFLKLLVHNPLGTAIKVGVGAALVYVLDNIGSFNLSPQAAVAVIALVNILINALNPHDPRYNNTVANNKEQH